MESYRDTYCVIYLDRLRDNLDCIYKIFKKPMYAVVKANAYGHGVKQVMDIVDDLPYIQGYCFATLKEAIDMREAGFTKSMLVIGTIREQDLIHASEHDVTITIFDKAIARIVSKVNFPIKVHIKIDTGMNRIGIHEKREFEEVLSLLEANPYVDVEGVFTHYATADDDFAIAHQASERFKDIIGDHKFSVVHASNSAAILRLPDDYTNCGRIGIAMYGIDPMNEYDIAIKPIMELYTSVMMVKKIHKGEHVGYNYTYQASEDEYIATLPIGYGDGFIRRNQGRNVYINGKEYPIVGRVCMDQTMVRVDATIKEGDQVEIFGSHITIDRMAKELETIPYEILCLLTPRVERKYIKRS